MSFGDFSMSPPSRALTDSQIAEYQNIIAAIMSWENIWADLMGKWWSPHPVENASIEYILGSFGLITKLSGIIPLRIKEWKINILHAHREELDSHAVTLYESIDHFSHTHDTRNIDTCREVRIRNTITCYLNNYVEYLAMSWDFEAAQIWYEKALFVAKTLHARQTYFDLLVYRIARFSSSGTGTNLTLTEYADFLEQYSLAAHDWFYGKTQGLSPVQMKERIARSERNMTQARLVSIYAFFCEAQWVPDSMPVFLERVGEFEAMKQEFMTTFWPDVGALTRYEIGDAILFHKIEHCIAQRVHDIGEWVREDSILWKYSTSVFWLPEGKSSSIGDHFNRPEKAIAFWRTHDRSPSLDLRLPLIQALSNSIRYSVWQDSLSIRDSQRELISTIARSMIHNNLANVHLTIWAYLEAQKNHPDVQAFVASLKVVHGRWIETFEPAEYIVAALMENRDFPWDLLSFLFVGWNWKIQYRIPGTDWWITMDGSDPHVTRSHQIWRGGGWIPIGRDYRIVWKLIQPYKTWLDPSILSLLERIYDVRMGKFLCTLMGKIRQKREVLTKLVAEMAVYIWDLRSSGDMSTVYRIPNSLNHYSSHEFTTSQLWYLQPSTYWVIPWNVIHDLMQYRLMHKEALEILRLMNIVLNDLSWGFSDNASGKQGTMKFTIEDFARHWEALIRTVNDFLSRMPVL